MEVSTKVGRREAGIYAFWTAVLERRKLCGRALAALPPGDRFREVKKWMHAHPKDARFANPILVRT